jgi:hypothetical protein
MSETFTTTDLLADIKRRAMIPADQNTFEDTDLLRLATDELRLSLLPMLLSEREEFYLTEAGASQTLVAGTAAYQIPARAAGQMLRDAYITDSAGNIFNLARIEYDERPNFDTVTTGIPNHFYLRNNKIVLLPTPSTASYTLVTPYFIRPSKLVETSDACQITDITGTTITVSATAPSTFSSSVATDFVRATGGFECVDIAVTPSSVSGTTFVYSSVPSGLAVGDWICVAGESTIPQLPAELHPLLAERVAKKVMKALGDVNGAKLADETIKEMTEGARLLTNARVQGEPKRIVAKQWWR